jgi:hypothetical protein
MSLFTDEVFGNGYVLFAEVRELEENNIRISCRTFVRFQGVMAGA